MIRIIAEIGINHNGNFATAVKLQEAAKEAGAWAVKYQIRTNFRECTPQHLCDTTRRWHGEDMPYLEYRRRLEFSDKQLRELYDHAKSLGLEWFASPWDVESVGRLAAIERDYCKVASAQVTNKLLLRAVDAEKFRRIFLSTGMSSQSDLTRAGCILAGNSVVLMACVSIYPCPDDLCNLRRILQWKYQSQIDEDAYYWVPCDEFGYSGHETGILPSLIAVGLGATYIERHLTLDKTQEGSDHAASLVPHELAELVRQAQRVESMLGDGSVGPLPEEEYAMRRLRPMAKAEI